MKLQRNPGNGEAATKARSGDSSSESNNLGNNEPDNENSQSTPHIGEKDDLIFTKNETIDFDGARLYLRCGRIKEPEYGGNERNELDFNKQKEATEEEPTRQEEDVCVLWNHVPEEITLHRTASSISYKFVMAVDTQEVHVRQEMMDGNEKFT